MTRDETRTTNLRFTETRRGTALVLSVAGEINIATASAFRQKLDEIVATGQTKVVLDLKETSYIGSSGLGAIARAAKQIREKGGELCLARVHYMSKQMMSFFGLLPIIKIFDDVNDALLHFTQSQGSR